MHNCTLTFDNIHSNILVISFSGYLENDILPFMFVETFNRTIFNKLFVRDIYKGWYLKGLYNISHSVPSTIDFIKTYCYKRNINKIICIGASMGGYASILYGKLLSTFFDTLSISFSPQTNLTKSFNLNIEPTDWMYEKLNSFVWNKISEKDEKYLDLKKVLGWKSRYKFNLSSYCSLGRELDKLYLENICEFGNINMFDIGDEHNIASWFKHNKKLINIINSDLKLL